MTILGSRAFSSSQITHVPLDTSSTTSILASYNPDMLLYPGIDSLNHNPLSQNRWFSNAERFGIICEDEPVEGEECWNPYGGKGNGERTYYCIRFLKSWYLSFGVTKEHLKMLNI